MKILWTNTRPDISLCTHDVETLIMVLQFLCWLARNFILFQMVLLVIDIDVNLVSLVVVVIGLAFCTILISNN